MEYGFEQVFENVYLVYVFSPIISDNGDIDFDEFCQLLARHFKDPGDEEQELREAFAVFDRNGKIY